MKIQKNNVASRKTTKHIPSARTKAKSSKTIAKAVPETVEQVPGKIAQEIEKKKVGLKLNWHRAIHIDTAIDDTLLKTLTPVILKMKQESQDPITIGIDSPGGSISAMKSLLGLLQTPDQDGNQIEIYTVSTNRTYSAAASLLAFGDYSVAFPHSTILYHDVRYSGIEDVTSSKALRTARELERDNVAFSLTLANQLRRRFVWVYLDLQNEFAGIRKLYASFADKYDQVFADVLPTDENRVVDIVGFALTLFRKLSHPVDNEISIQALHLLDSWMQIEKMERRLTGDSEGMGNISGLVSGMNHLVTEIRSMESGDKELAGSPEPTENGLSESAQKDIRLLIEVIVRRFATNKNLDISSDGFDIIMEDYAFIKDINSDKHVNAITKLMMDNAFMFFKTEIAAELNKAKDDDERRKILDPVYPQARILWLYIVLICRCLCKGEHLLTPYDAQLLGLVDEVLGGGLVESRREWRKSQPDYC
jgi:ATP-dependent protease ClpP protease subunit